MTHLLEKIANAFKPTIHRHPRFVSLTSDGYSLYGLSEDGNIWRQLHSGLWMQIDEVGGGVE